MRPIPLSFRHPPNEGRAEKRATDWNRLPGPNGALSQRARGFLRPSQKVRVRERLEEPENELVSSYAPGTGCLQDVDLKVGEGRPVELLRDKSARDRRKPRASL